MLGLLTYLKISLYFRPDGYAGSCDVGLCVDILVIGNGRHPTALAGALTARPAAF